MPISWNEIRHNAIKFSRDWVGVKSESAEKQTFCRDLANDSTRHDEIPRYTALGHRWRFWEEWNRMG